MRIILLVLVCGSACLLFIGCETQREARTEELLPKEFDAEMEVLTSLSDNELFKVGLTSTDAGWSIAWSTDSAEDSAAIKSALETMGITVSGSCGRRRCGWYVEPEIFFCSTTGSEGKFSS